MEEFVEKPHPSLGNWPPCPYARQARLSNNIEVRQGSWPFADGMSLLKYNWDKEVVVYWYDDVDADEFVDQVQDVNSELMPNDIVGLEDHPDTNETISGIRMNFGLCAIVVYQQLSKLNSAADQLRAKGYYNTWSEGDIDNIVTWRYN
jgi:hypothetical protein